MSNAPRPARWNSRSRSWAGQARVFGQRQSASSSSPGQLGTAGRAVGRELELALVAGAQVGHRADDLGDHVPGLAQHDHVADEHTLALHLTALCRVAISTVEPLTLAGSITPNGVTRPVRPTLTWMSSSRVVTSSGAYL